MNHLNFWKGKLEAPTFFAIKTPRQAVWVPYDSRQLSKIPLSASLWGKVVKATIKLAYLYRPLSISIVSIWNGKITSFTNKHGQVNAIIIRININWNWNYMELNFDHNKSSVHCLDLDLNGQKTRHNFRHVLGMLESYSTPK